MKILAIDSGNSKIKSAVFDGEEIVYTSSVELSDYEPEIAKILKNFQIDKFGICDVSQNYGTIRYNINKLTDYKLNGIMINYKLNLPFKTQYSPIHQLGNDRIAALSAASYLYPNTNVLIIDYGTAITIDLLTAENIHLGGNISPGINMRYMALDMFTSALPLVEFNSNLTESGTNTETAINNGVVKGIIYETEGYIKEFTDKYPGLVTILTGGISEYLHNSIKYTTFANPNLVLYGIKKLVETNDII
jgi:type III pantothenate kinase